MRIIEARKWTPETYAFLWEETGHGSLRQVTSIRADWWIVTGQCSWCCSPDTLLFVPNDAAELKELEGQMQERLKKRRFL